MGGFALHWWPSNALPAHFIVRLERLGEAIPEGAERAVVLAAIELTRQSKRVLRVDAEICDRNDARRRRIARRLQEASFVIQPQVRTYEQTLAIDVQKSDELLLGSFSARARRAIRKAQRAQIHVSPIDDNTLIPQLEAIQRETYQRTGANAPVRPWPKLLSAVRRSPNRIQIFGASFENSDNARQIVAFALVIRNGTSVQYDVAGSTRLPESNVPLMYPVIWKLLRWARDTGASWFDFGGITDISLQENQNPLHGISEFKRTFGGEQLIVGEDWRLNVAPRRQQLIRIARRLIVRPHHR